MVSTARLSETQDGKQSVNIQTENSLDASKPSLKKQTVERVFDERKEFLVIGLTGLKGSGCTTVCKYLSSNFRSLSLENVSFPQGTAKDDTHRDKRILRIFASQNWEPFDVIKGRDVILSFALQNWESFEELIDPQGKKSSSTGLTKFETKFNDKLLQHVETLNKKITFFQGLIKNDRDNDGNVILKNSSGRCFYDVELLNYLESFIKDMNSFIEVTDKESYIGYVLNKLTQMNAKCIDYWENTGQTSETTKNEEDCKENYVYIHTILPWFGDLIYDVLEDKALLTSIFQQLGNRIRYYGSIEKPSESNEKHINTIYAFPTRVNSFIKVLRHPIQRNQNARVRVVIDSLKNVYEAKYLRSRYSAFYLIAITRDEDIRIQGLEKKRIFGDSLKLIDFNERPNKARKLFKRFIEECVKDDNHKNISLEYLLSIDKNQSGIKEIEEKVKKKPEYIPCLKALSDEVRVKAYLNNLQQFFLQDVESCIQDADIFISNNEQDGGKSRLKFSIVRYVSLMQHPGLVLPTPIERCMQIAYTAKANSGCISRQVGAVATDSNYRILSIGWNDVPCGQTSCIRRNITDLHRYHDLGAYSKFERGKESEFRSGYLNKFDFSDEKKLANAFHGLPVAYCFKDAYQTITDERNQVHTRSMHGEEKALLYCNQELIKGGYLFTTSSPCELCSKNAKEHFIKTIYYIEPYPGISQSHICDSGDEDNQAKYELFQGAIGRAYTQLFTPLMPYKDELALRGFPDDFTNEN